MDEEERMNLYIKKYKKHIKNVEIAKEIGCSKGLISGFFNGKNNVSKEKLDKIIKFIDNYPEFVMFKVAVKSKN